MKLLAEIPSGQMLTSGLFPGLQGLAPVLWSEGENIIFEDGGVRKAFGYTELATLAATPTGMTTVVAETEPRAFIGAGQNAYRYRSSDGLTNIGSFAASGGIYQFLPWDTQCLISNGVDPLELWTGSGTSSAITAPFTMANCVFGYQTQAFVGGTDNGGQLVEWSSINSITDWTPTALNSAGNLRLRTLSGDIVAAKKLGGSIGIYGRSNAGLFSYIGGTASYGFSRPLTGVGAVSPYSVVSAGNRHYGIQQDSVFVTDLVSFANIDEPAMRTYLRDNTDWDRQTEIYGWLDYAQSMVRWKMPKLGGGTFGIGYRFDSGTWTKFNDGMLLGHERGTFDNMLTATGTRLLRQNKTLYDNNLVAMTAFVRTKPLDFGRRHMRKRVQRIAVDGTWSGTVSFKIGFSDNPNATPSWDVTETLASNIYPDKLSQKSEGIYLSFEIYSSALAASWKISGITVYGEETAYEP